MFELSGKVVVVTGGGSGIGRALAVKAASRGASVAIADIDLARAQSLADEIGERARAFHVDVTQESSFEALAGAILSAFGKVHVVFNNAGVYAWGPLEKTRMREVDWLIAVNIRGTINGSLAFLPLLRERAAAGELAHIVNIGSENAVSLPTNGEHTAYTATKHAVLGLTDGLRRDLEGSGIGVSLICPGVVRTNLWNSRRVRPDQFGGAREAPPELAQSLDIGRSAEDTVETAFEGLDAGEFLIITDNRIRGFTEPRLHMLAEALDACDRRLPPVE